MDWLGENGVPFAIVFTKLDKMSAAAAKIVTGKIPRQTKRNMGRAPPVFYTSSHDGRGRAQLLDYIDEPNQLPTMTTRGTSSDINSTDNT